MPTSPVPSIVCDPALAGAVISPFLFGHNIEHTRRAMWRGLSAQLIANRKFAGEVQLRDTAGAPVESQGRIGADGVVARWSAVGSGARYAHDRYIGYAGSESQRLIIDGATTAGIAQGGLALEQGRSYRLRVCVKVDRAATLTMRVSDAAGTREQMRRAVPVAAGDWREVDLDLTVAHRDPDARLELTVAGPVTAWFGAVSLLPSDHVLGLRRDVVELLREMSVPMLRWPGGNFSLDYRWQDGLLPVDRRPTIRLGMSEVLPFSDSCDFHELAIDEFIALCRELKAEPFITVNCRPQDFGTVDDAVAWLEYCNGTADSTWGRVRAERGHPEPYRVRYWSIGNEVWGAHMLQGHCTAEVYAERVAQFAPAMRRVDPTIIITVVGIPAPTWDTIVVARAGQHVDYLSGHEYVRPEGHDVASYKRLADAASNEERDKLTVMRERIDANAGGKTIGIALDEWNLWHEWFAAPSKHEWHVGPVDGAFTAAMLNLFCRDFERVGLTLVTYFQPINEGAIAVGPFSASFTPVGQAYRMFRAHHGQRLIPLRTTSGEVDACASLSADGRRVCVTIVSHDPGHDHRVDITVPGSGPVQAEVLVLSSVDTTPDRPLQERMLRVDRDAGESWPIGVPRFGMVLVTIRLG
ncbi:MAG: hypothetical protein H0W83_07330 [Planctomycetes bacterium]|nr:hypothetical protein [Planctomycetota bacterium]